MVGNWDAYKVERVGTEECKLTQASTVVDVAIAAMRTLTICSIRAIVKYLVVVKSVVLAQHGLIAVLVQNTVVNVVEALHHFNKVKCLEEVARHIGKWNLLFIGEGQVRKLSCL